MYFIIIGGFRLNKVQHEHKGILATVSVTEDKSCRHDCYTKAADNCHTRRPEGQAERRFHGYVVVEPSKSYTTRAVHGPNLKKYKVHVDGWQLQVRRQTAEQWSIVEQLVISGHRNALANNPNGNDKSTSKQRGIT
jgi:hypothetical protein